MTTAVKYYCLLFSLIILFSVKTNAQRFLHEFGKYSNEEFELKSYAKDPTAEAVIIYDIGKSYFVSTETGFELYFERTTKYKVFNKAGLKWAEISIPYYRENNRSEDIFELKGNTYNMENGQVRITPLNDTRTYNEKYSENWYDKKFAMPDVKEGSIFEVSYKIRSPYLFNLRNWEFQNRIPVIYSEYNTRMIPFYEYTYILQGTTKFTESQSYEDHGLTNRFAGIEYHDMVYNFVMKDLPGFKDEQFITSMEDYIVKLDFQLAAIHRPDGSKQLIMTTWQKLNEEMLDNPYFGKYLKNCQKKGKEFTDTLKIAPTQKLERAKALDRYVKSNYNWNGFQDKFTKRSIKDLLNTKTGNSCEINLFLTGLLNAAGIEAYPVILSSRNHGKIKYDYPFHHFFNTVVVFARIDSSEYLLDATDPFCRFGEIPTRCINDKGLVIQKDKVEWVDLKENTVSTIKYIADLTFNPTVDSIKQSFTLAADGYEASQYRRKFVTSVVDLKKSLQFSGSKMNDSLKVSNLQKVDLPFQLEYTLMSASDKIENKVLIEPFCHIPLTENPLKQAFRNYPVDFVYKKSTEFQITIHIPAGYKLLSKPEDLVINNNLVKVVFSAEVKEANQIVVKGIYQFKKDVYNPSDYFDLKGFFNKIIDKFNEKIVLEKTN